MFLEDLNHVNQTSIFYSNSTAFCLLYMFMWRKAILIIRGNGIQETEEEESNPDIVSQGWTTADRFGSLPGLCSTCINHLKI